MIEGKFAPSFPLRLMHKDLGLALELARRRGIELPATSAAYSTYSAVKSSDHGRRGLCCGSKILEKVESCPPRKSPLTQSERRSRYSDQFRSWIYDSAVPDMFGGELTESGLCSNAGRC